MKTARALVESPRRLLIAHRGASTEAPENTLPAFEAGLDAGADFVELDYLHSAEGVPVVFHDLLLERTTNAARLWPPLEHGTPLAFKTVPQLRELDAGSWFDPRFAGTKLSTLGEVLARIAPRGCVMVERKYGDAATLARVLEQHQADERVVVQAFDWFFLAELRERAPHLLLGALGSGEPSAHELREIRAVGARLVGWDQRNLSADVIRRFHEAGLKVWSWTIDRPERARELLAAGLDGVITNVPRLLRPLVT